MLLALFTFPPTFELEDEGDRDIGRGVDVNDGTDGWNKKRNISKEIGTVDGI